MNEFLEALLCGEKNAEKNSTNNGEIDFILLDFFEAIEVFTNKKVSATIDNYKGKSTHNDGKVQAIILFGKKNKDLMAFWKRSKDGYPCSITNGCTEVVCTNKEELKEELKSLLSDSFIVKKIKEMMLDG